MKQLNYKFSKAEWQKSFETAETICNYLQEGASLRDILQENLGDKYGDPDELLRAIDMGIDGFDESRRRVHGPEDLKRMLKIKFGNADKFARYRAYLGMLAVITEAMEPDAGLMGMVKSFEDTLEKFKECGYCEEDFPGLDADLQIMEDLLLKYSQCLGPLFCRCAQSRELTKMLSNADPEEVREVYLNNREGKRILAVAMLLEQDMKGIEAPFESGVARAEFLGGVAAARAEADEVIRTGDVRAAENTLNEIGLHLMGFLMGAGMITGMVLVGMTLLELTTPLVALLGIGLSIVPLSLIAVGLSELIDRSPITQVVCNAGRKAVDAVVCTGYKAYHGAKEWMEDKVMPKVQVVVESTKNFFKQRVAPKFKAIGSKIKGLFAKKRKHGVDEIPVHEAAPETAPQNCVRAPVKEKAAKADVPELDPWQAEREDEEEETVFEDTNFQPGYSY